MDLQPMLAIRLTDGNCNCYLTALRDAQAKSIVGAKLFNIQAPVAVPDADFWSLLPRLRRALSFRCAFGAARATLRGVRSGSPVACRGVSNVSPISGRASSLLLQTMNV